MSLKFFHLERLEKHISELAMLRYREVIALDEIAATPDLIKGINEEPVQLGPSSFTMKKGEFWSGRDEYIWLHKEIQVPQEWEGFL